MNKKILIIENDPDTMEVLEHIVKALELEPLCIGEAIEVEMIDQIRPALVLLDHWLDDSLGCDVCLAIKDHPSTSGIPVILLSASSGVSALAVQAGASAFMPKPFDLEVLEARIRQLIGVV